MLRRVKDLRGFGIRARDSEIGQVDQFYFDDENWTIRYLVANTGSWLVGRQVLISPIAVGETDWESKQLEVELTKQQVENSPHIDAYKPISRQREAEYYGYYGYPYYWGGPFLWGPAVHPRQVARSRADRSQSATPTADGDSHLRSTKEVTGYRIEATDGEIGHVEDFIVDDENWAIRYMLVDTRNWWPGKKVLVSPRWIKRVSWTDSRVYVDLSREAIKSSPEYDESPLINRQYESSLYSHYGRPPYWS
jgi:hypothetical protein